MKTLLILALLFFFPSAVFSHPGKTDKRGGHKCWKGCAEWQLEYGEYHLHDRDFRPIRVDTEGNPVETAELPGNAEKVPAAAAESSPVHTGMELPKEKPVEPAPAISSLAVFSEGRSCPVNISALLLSALVVVLIAALRAIRTARRKREQGDS